MPARKTSPPEEPKDPAAKKKAPATGKADAEKKTAAGKKATTDKKKPTTKKPPAAKKKPAARKPLDMKKEPTAEAAVRVTLKEPKPKAPVEKNDTPQTDQSEPKKPRPRSPINGAELPIGQPFKPGEEAREKARRGGKRSGEVRRARKTFREEMLELLQITSKDSSGKEHTQQEYVLAAMIKEARGGNVRAFESILSTVGEKQQERLEVAVSLPKFEALDAAFSSMAGDTD